MPVYQIYFWNKTLHVSDSISVHHQESCTVHTAIGIGHTINFTNFWNFNMTYTYCCIYSARLLMMEMKPVRNMYRSIPKINLRKFASRCFCYKIKYELTHKQKRHIKFCIVLYSFRIGDFNNFGVVPWSVRESPLKTWIYLLLLWRVCGRGEVCTGFWWGDLRERDHWGDPGVIGRIILRWVFRKWDVGIWTGSSWLRIGTGGGHLWMWVP